jgi:hypothetical protein
MGTSVPRRLGLGTAVKDEPGLSAAVVVSIGRHGAQRVLCWRHVLRAPAFLETQLIARLPPARPTMWQTTGLPGRARDTVLEWD